MFRKLFTTALATFALGAFAPAALAAVDVNRASQAELESVKGIGPGLSTKILKAREAGQFKDWPDMVERVGGIGPGSAAKLSQAGLTVGGGAYDGGSAPASGKAKKTAAATPSAEADTTTAKAARKSADKGR